MCFGRQQQAAPQSVIYMPQTSSYDDQFDRQMDLLRQQMDNQNKMMQQQLQSSLDRTRDLMGRIVEARTQQAETPQVIDEEVRERVEVIAGPVQDLTPPPVAPPPVSSASIVMGREPGASRESDVLKRGGAKKPGKAGLRIPRAAGASSGAGVGLNIS